VQRTAADNWPKNNKKNTRRREAEDRCRSADICTLEAKRSEEKRSLQAFRGEDSASHTYDREALDE
jgi:hypothetical protein